MNKMYETLEICLQELEQGADLETVLFRYPELADELRPILEGSINAKRMAIVAPSAEVVRRNRAKVLQHAAQMREAKSKSSQRIWFVSLRRLAVTLAVVVALFVSGTGLVSAASTTLPGDNLYPIKRTWEDVLLLFTFNLQQREVLEIEHENERLHELMELFTEGRSADVDFAGTVTSQTGNEWVVNGVRVVVSPQTEVRDGPIMVGSAVRVRGLTQGKGIVLAERIRLLSPDDKLPEIEYEGDEESDNEGSNQQIEDNSGPGSGNESPDVENTNTPESDDSNSGNGNDSDSNDKLNENGSDDSHSNDSSDNEDDNSASDDNSNLNDNNESGDDSGGGNDNGGDDNSNNDNGDDSGGGSNSGSSGGGGDD